MAKIIMMALYAVFVALLALLVDAGAAVAATSLDPVVNNHLVLPTAELWAFIAGNLAPLVAYLLNFAGPWVSEKIKGLVQIVVAAVAGGIAQAITAGGVGLNQTTMQFIVTAVFGALLAHRWFWQPSTIGKAFGAGRNIGDQA